MKINPNDNNEITKHQQEKLEEPMSARGRVRQFVYEFVNTVGQHGNLIREKYCQHPVVEDWRAEAIVDARDTYALKVLERLQKMYPEMRSNIEQLSTVRANFGHFVPVHVGGTVRAMLRLVDDSGQSPVIHHGHVSITNASAMGIITKMQRKKNNKGWVVFFTVVGHTYSGKTYVREKKGVCLTINETDNGVKLLWFVNNKPYWATNDQLIGHFYCFDSIIWANLVEEIEAIYPVDRFIHVAKYLPHKRDGYKTTYGRRGSNVPQVWDLKKWEMNNFGSGTNIKDMLNKIYGKSGQLGLTKNAFGGLNKLVTLSDLFSAGYIVKLFKNLPASFFEKINGDLLPHGEHYLNLEHERVKEWSKNMGYFLKHFNRPTIQEEILSCLEKFLRGSAPSPHGPRSATGYTVTEDFYQLITAMSDTGSMLRQIRNRTVRRNVLAFRGSIQDIHDFAVLEYGKMKHQNRKIKYSENVNALNGQRIQGEGTMMIECVLPYDTHTLVEWGSQQKNCIGSYADSVLQKTSLIIGFKNVETNDWIGHAELKKYVNGVYWISQLSGKYNRRLDPADDLVIREFLENWINNRRPELN
jgi:hypothetical protein